MKNLSILIAFCVFLAVFSGCGKEEADSPVSKGERPEITNQSSAQDESAFPDDGDFVDTEHYEDEHEDGYGEESENEDVQWSDASNAKLSFPFDELLTLENKEEFLKTVPKKDGLFDITPYGIGNFFTNFNLENDLDIKEDDNAGFYGFTDSFSPACSVWCSVNDYHESWKASSTLPHINKINYNAKNLGDSSRATVWCEGVEGYGIGQSVEADVTIEMYGPFHYTTLCIVNGYAKNETAWEENARVKKLKMYVNGKPYAYLSLDDTIKPQYFSIYDIESNGEASTKFKFEIVDVYAGTKFKDTCLTGIAFGFWRPNH